MTGLGAALLIGLGATVAAAATTPSPGVHIDPGSPVAKQYAIPLATARGGGSGGGLFGRGITRARSHHAAAHKAAPTVTPAAAPAVTPAPSVAPVRVVQRAPHRTSARHTLHRRHQAAPTATTPAARATAPAPARAPVPAASYSPTRAASSGTGLAWMLGVAALVLTLGGLGSAALARYGRRTSASAS